MAGRATSWLSRPQLLRTLVAQLRVAVRLIREPAVSTLTKIIPILAVLYLIDPIDIVPDVLPIVGQLDDLAVLIAALETFLKFCPRAAKAFHESAIAQGRRYSPMPGDADVIDAEWRRE